MYFQALWDFGIQKNQSKWIDYMLSSNIKVQTETSLEQMMGIEPTWSAWKAEVLPLNYICISLDIINYTISI